MHDSVVVAVFEFAAGIMIGLGFIKAVDSYGWMIAVMLFGGAGFIGFGLKRRCIP